MLICYSNNQNGDKDFKMGRKLTCHYKKKVSISLFINGGARSVMVIVAGYMDTATRVQILDLTDCISHSTNTLGKGMNPIILPPAMGK